jgi:hypothetical protein
MKTIKSLRFIATLMAIAAFMLVIKSCKKVDNDGVINTKEAEAAKAAAIQSVKAQYGDISAGVVYNVNKQANELFYKNAEGKMVSLYGAVANAANGPDISAPGPGSCVYNCTNTTNPANLRIIYTLNYVQRFYQCESSSTTPNKSRVSVKWTIAAPNTFFDLGIIYIPTADIKFTSSAGATLLTLTESSPPAVYLNPVGPDPGCPQTHTLYEVTCTFNNIANTYFASGNQISCSLVSPNSCALTNYVVASGYVAAPAFSQNAYLPCNRVDKVYISPASSAGSAQTTVLGNSVGTCNNPSGFITITNHQLEYRKVTSTTGSLLWTDQSGTVYGTAAVFNGSQSLNLAPNGFGYLSYMLPNTGKWIVRYRNVYIPGNCLNILGLQTFPGVNQGNGTWLNTALWVTEMYNTQ